MPFIAIVCGVLLYLYFGGEKLSVESIDLLRLSLFAWSLFSGGMSKVIDEYVTIALLEFILVVTLVKL
ncbi:hypothetical protein KF7HA_01201 [Lactococcus lactis]|nr:hypothetical protein [Lactococcus lactis]